MSTVVIWPTRKPMYLALHNHYATTNGPSDGPSEGPSEKPGGGLLKYLFYASLTHGIIPDRAAGGTVITFTRDSVATVTDHEGIIRTCKKAEARFLGARRVENLLRDSENIATGNGYWIALSGAEIINTNTVSIAGSSGSSVRQVTAEALIGPVASKSFRFSADVWVDTGTADFRLKCTQSAVVDNFSPDLVATTTRQRFSMIVHNTSAAGNGAQDCSISQVALGGVPYTIHFENAQLENVSGQSNQTPSEYVSTDVLTLPYHGANVDGVQYFDTTNGNSVDENNVVIEGEGIELPEMAGLVDSQGPFGYVSETTSTNLITYSEEFDNASVWTPARITTDAESAAAPDGTSSADVVLEDGTAANSHELRQVITPDGVSAYTFSIYAKALNRHWMGLGISTSGFPAAASAYFDLANGEVGTVLAGVDTAAIEAVGNGWYRCSIRATSDVAVSSVFTIGLSEGDNTPVFDGLSQESLILWGAQLEAGSLSTYIPTQDSVVSRVADVLTYSSEGNIEDEAGTAMAQASTFWSVSAAESYVLGRDAGGRIMQVGNVTPSDRFRTYDGSTLVNSGAGGFMNETPKQMLTSWGENLSVVFDGSDVASGAYDGTFGIGDLAIGALNTGANQWNGTIREVTISDEETTDDA